MARRKAKGIVFNYGVEYSQKLKKLEDSAREQLLGPAIYDGTAALMAEIREQMERVPTDERFGSENDPARGPRRHTMAVIKENLGVARLRDDNGFLNVKIGWDGYSDIQTKRWPNGQPIPMLAAAVCRGTSFMEGHDFLKKSVNSKKNAVLKTMQTTMDKHIEKIMKEQKG